MGASRVEVLIRCHTPELKPLAFASISVRAVCEQTRLGSAAAEQTRRSVCGVPRLAGASFCSKRTPLIGGPRHVSGRPRACGGGADEESDTIVFPWSRRLLLRPLSGQSVEIAWDGRRREQIGTIDDGATRPGAGQIARGGTALGARSRVTDVRRRE
jgi:hypothetical protein